MHLKQADAQMMRLDKNLLLSPIIFKIKKNE